MKVAGESALSSAAHVAHGRRACRPRAYFLFQPPFSLSLSLSVSIQVSSPLLVFHGFPPFHRHFISSFVSASFLPAPRLRVTFERSSVLSLAFKPSHTKVKEFKRKKGRPSAILYRLSINEKSNRFHHGSFCSTCFVRYLSTARTFNYYYGYTVFVYIYIYMWDTGYVNLQTNRRFARG